MNINNHLDRLTTTQLSATRRRLDYIKASNIAKRRRCNDALRIVQENIIEVIGEMSSRIEALSQYRGW